MKNKTLLIPLILAFAVSSNAQSISPSTLNATGKSTVIGSNEFEWSVGEMTMVNTFTTSSVIITQGVLQPADQPSVVSDNALSRQLKLFPNPSSSVVNLQYTGSASGVISCRLMDVTGKLISNNSINISRSTSTMTIDVSRLPAASYLLEVILFSEDNKSDKISYVIEKLN